MWYLYWGGGSDYEEMWTEPGDIFDVEFTGLSNQSDDGVWWVDSGCPAFTTPPDIQSPVKSTLGMWQGL